MNIVKLEAADLRFPTSSELHGSDAMNPAPDYSAATCVLKTSVDGLEGHGMTFTVGRGNEICVDAIRALAPFVVGLSLDQIRTGIGDLWRAIVQDSQLRWLGPEKGVIHLAAAAVINAAWDLWAKVEQKPVWRLITEMTPQEIVDVIDFRHITDALTPGEAREMLEHQTASRKRRTQVMRRDGLPGYETSAGWLGYDDQTVERLCREANEIGWSGLKFKVSREPAKDLARCRLAREILGPDRRLMIDANQVWEVDEAIANMRILAEVRPWWIEEPLSPDDILGHRRVADAVRPIRVATGEHCHNKVMFKQFLQADAIDVVQIDACRLAGLNENLAVMLLAAKFGKAVCPHAGGVGLCEYVQHLGAIDFIAVGGERDDRMIEHAGHLHEHFVDPVVTRNGAYVPTEQPGFSVEFRPESVAAYEFPNGAYWKAMTR